MANPNQFYDIVPDHPDARELSGSLIGEIQRLRSGDTVAAGNGYGIMIFSDTYLLHLSDPNHESFNTRSTLPADGHIVVSNISREGWRRICDIVGRADDDSWKSVQRAIDEAPELNALQVMTSSIGLVARGGYN